MNAKRLLKLADFLSELPSQKFDFGVIAVEGRRPMREALKAPKENCGTTGCAIGWMPAVFPRLVRWKPPEEDDWKRIRVVLRADEHCNDFGAARTVFGISPEDAEYLFLPDGNSGLGFEASAKRVARHIRRFVKRGGRPLLARYA